MKATTIVLLAGVLALILAAPGFSGPNLLVNPSFEDGPTYGDFTGVPYAPSGWTQGPEENTADHNWGGVYDSSWKNHNCNYPAWPDPVHQPVDGNYFLAKWLAPQSGCETYTGIGGGTGYVYQTITGLSEGTYYFSVWTATNHSHGTGLARIVALPQAYDGTTFNPPLHGIYPINTPFMDANPVPSYASTGRAAAPEETGDTSGWPFYRAEWKNSDERWSKLTCKVVVGPGQSACTVFLATTHSTNNVAEPQYCQMDAARFANTQLLEIKNVQITSINPTGATIEWDVYDGDNKVTGAATSVDYGTTTSYGSNKPGTELDPDYCHDLGTLEPYPGRPGHYTAILTGLTTNTQYHFRVKVNAGTYTSVGPYSCDGSIVPTFSRAYEAAESADVFPLVPLPAISITNVNATSITKNSATITWNTNVAASGQVNYGKFGTIDQTKAGASSATSHSVVLTGLDNNTPYSYTVTAAASGYSTTTSTVKTFNTLPGPNIMNGDFEYLPHNGGIAKYWSDVKPLTGGVRAMGPILRLSGDYSVPAHSGNWHYGVITNGSAHPPDGTGVYQQIETTPGDIVSVYAWSWANGQGINGGQGAPHRFGEINNQIGVDPKGLKPTLFVYWQPSIVWGSQQSTLDWHLFPLNPDSRTGGYRRIASCAVAEANLATVYLRTRSWFGNAWLFNTFDDVTVEPPTPVQSVGQLKTLPMQTNVNLTQGDYVVTYVQISNPDLNENNGQPYFYIQDCAKGGAGIKVTIAPRATWPSWIAEGKKVNIVGTLDWGIFQNYRFGNLEQQTRLDKPAGEPVLRACKITDTGLTAALPEPVGVTNLSLGGGSSADCYFTNAGVAGGSGANNVGMRVRTWGKIVEIGYDTNYWVYMVIDDGSRLPLPPAAPMTLSNGTMTMTTKIADWQHEPGLYVQTWDGLWPTHDDGVTPVAVGDYVILTGVSGVRLDLDTDDVNCVVPTSPNPEFPDLIPEAEKNMRCIKLDWIDGAKYIKL